MSSSGGSKHKHICSGLFKILVMSYTLCIDRELIMADQENTEAEANADAYYNSDDGQDEELDLSFLDEK